MKCMKCGQKASHSYQIDFDGVEKKISYCKKCVAEVLRNSVPLRKIAGVPDETLKKGRHVFEDEMVVFVEIPVYVLEQMFGKWHPQEREVLLNERKIAFLERKLKEAIKNEDYRRASRLKQLITQIKRKMDVK
ncbi:UvrB/UvrC motif-containing protein [Thermotoga sp. SG1]|uniref:UvrB/UvrC motif-containing protein n=1 Tax=Thermotoga sp. SG1 TaxID=126739 RepID=UPI000C7741E6|nr:UvrB/UvrC motif-containing protein [Thermotoga sp. SG1]PLV55495.1 DNA helicase UvrBC [Thermotoga sp. SG1]